MAKTITYYRFTFTDNHIVIARGLSRQELTVEEKKHGKLIRKVKEM